VLSTPGASMRPLDPWTGAEVRPMSIALPWSSSRPMSPRSDPGGVAWRGQPSASSATASGSGSMAGAGCWSRSCRRPAAPSNGLARAAAGALRPAALRARLDLAAALALPAPEPGAGSRGDRRAHVPRRSPGDLPVGRPARRLLVGDRVGVGRLAGEHGDPGRGAGACCPARPPRGHARVAAADRGRSRSGPVEPACSRRATRVSGSLSTSSSRSDGWPG